MIYVLFQMYRNFPKSLYNFHSFSEFNLKFTYSFVGNFCRDVNYALACASFFGVFCIFLRKMKK